MSFTVEVDEYIVDNGVIYLSNKLDSDEVIELCETLKAMDRKGRDEIRKFNQDLMNVAYEWGFEMPDDSSLKTIKDAEPIEIYLSSGFSTSLAEIGLVESTMNSIQRPIHTYVATHVGQTQTSIFLRGDKRFASELAAFALYDQTMPNEWVKNNHMSDYKDRHIGYRDTYFRESLKNTKIKLDDVLDCFNKNKPYTMTLDEAIELGVVTDKWGAQDE